MVQALATGWPDEQTRTLLERATTDQNPDVLGRPRFRTNEAEELRRQLRTDPE